MSFFVLFVEGGAVRGGLLLLLQANLDTHCTVCGETEWRGYEKAPLFTFFRCLLCFFSLGFSLPFFTFFVTLCFVAL